MKSWQTSFVENDFYFYVISKCYTKIEVGVNVNTFLLFVASHYAILYTHRFFIMGNMLSLTIYCL